MQRVIIIDDDLGICALLAAALEHNGYSVVVYHSAEAFLAESPDPAVVILDHGLPGMSGTDLQAILPSKWPVIFLSATDDTQTVVSAVRNGCYCYYEKPVKPSIIVEAVAKVTILWRHALEATEKRERHLALIGLLTPKERRVFNMVCQGYKNVEIAAELCRSVRTIEGHRDSVMKKTGAKSVADLVKLRAAAFG